MSKIKTEALKTIGGTYIRAFITGVATAAAIGKTEPADLFKAGVAAIIPVLMRWANPKDSFPQKA